jgi:hypothetical protein
VKENRSWNSNFNRYFIKSTIFWVVMPCSPLKVNRRFGWKHRLHLQSSTCHLLSRWFLARLIYRPRRWRRYVPPKHRLTFNALQGVISQKTVLFITTAVRTSNSRYFIGLRKNLLFCGRNISCNSNRERKCLYLVDNDVMGMKNIM